MTGIDRRRSVSGAVRARTTLSSADNLQQRAENIMLLAGFTEGDPAIIAEQCATIRDTLENYEALDRAARGR